MSPMIAPSIIFCFLFVGVFCKLGLRAGRTAFACLAKNRFDPVYRIRLNFSLNLSGKAFRSLSIMSGTEKALLGVV